MRELRFNIKYLLIKKEFYFAIMIAFAVNFIQVLLCVCENIMVSSFIEESYSSEYQFILYNGVIVLNVFLVIVFPVLYSMILSDSSYLDAKRKTIYMLAMRQNYKKNIIVRVVLSFLITFIISFISFLFNYFLLTIIYGSGNYISYFQEAPFNLNVYPSYFLDSVRLFNPFLFTILTSFMISIFYALISMISYVISFFVKNRIIIYFIPICFLIISEVLFSLLGFNFLSFIGVLQVFSGYGIENYFICSGVFLLLGILFLLIHFRKREILV